MADGAQFGAHAAGFVADDEARSGAVKSTPRGGAPARRRVRRHARIDFHLVLPQRGARQRGVHAMQERHAEQRPGGGAQRLWD